MRALHARLLPLLLQQQTRLHAAAGRGSSGEHAQHLRWLLRTPACQGVSPLTADGTSRAFVKRAAAAAAKKHKQRKQTQQHSVEPKQSTEPKSARESAAAMRRAMLQQLQHMGVRHPTAVALQKVRCVHVGTLVCAHARSVHAVTRCTRAPRPTHHNLPPTGLDGWQPA
jgi:hypothetical protein